MSTFHNMLPFRRRAWAVAAAAWCLGLAQSVQAQQQYCSSDNTGADSTLVTDIYNSNGACTKACGPLYAFAIVQYQNCWCSNYAPAAQLSVSNCQEGCPGFPSDKCGNEQQNLYGYIALGQAPLGTASGPVQSSTSSAPSTTSSSPTPSSAPVSETIYLTVTQPASVEVSFVTPATPTSSTTSSSATISITPSQITSVLVITQSGAVVTSTVTTTPTPVANGSDTSGTNNLTAQRSTGLSGGAIAGIVVGALLGIALIIAALFFFRRRRNEMNADGPTDNNNRHLGRNVSVLSKAGLLSRGGRPSMTEISGGGGAGRDGSHSARHSMLYGGSSAHIDAIGPAGIVVHPESPLDGHFPRGTPPGTAGYPIGPNGRQRTNSSSLALGMSGGAGAGSAASANGRHMVYDQRLNPSALFANHDNGSRISMQDQQDYSRPLGVMNPDPDDDDETRSEYTQHRGSRALRGSFDDRRR